MVRIALVTDSTANLAPEWARQHQVQVVPVYIQFEGVTYRDGLDMDTATFYRRLSSATTLPSTSQPSAGDFLACYRSLAPKVDAIVSVHISGELSGTVASAQAARQQLLAEMENPPEIHVIDSRVTSAAQALLVTAAADMIAAGRAAAEVVSGVTGLIPRLFTAFIVDTLDYLRRGGRIGAAAALVGSLLQIRPILQLRHGRVDVLGKMRTSRRARQRLLEIVVQEAGGRPIHAAVAHADAPEEGEDLRRYLSEHLDCRELFVVEFSPVVGAHSGPGTLAVAFYPEVGTNG